MKFQLLKKRKRKAKEHTEINSRLYWMFLITFFVLTLTGEMIYFSMYFVRINKKLDAPAMPTLETNAARISSMKKRLEAVDEAIMSRTGKIRESSQNNSSMVQ